MKSMEEVITENREEIDRHLNAVADIIQLAGNQDAINRLTVAFPEFPNFIIRWMRDGEEELHLYRTSEQPQFEALPGPYKIDSLSGSAMRVDRREPPFVIITDTFGGHEAMILESVWEEWEDAPNS